MTLMVTLVVAMALTGPSAWAISVGNGPGPGESSQHDPVWGFALGGPPTRYGWVMYSGVPVTLDPNAGPWTKQLNLEPYDVYEEDGEILLVLEALIVDGSAPWTGWHEEILTPGWEWATVDIEVYGISDGVLFGYESDENPGTLTPVPGFSFNLQPTTLDFFFDPILPGSDVSDIYIAKGLVFVGVDPGNPNETTSSPVFISEYPTGAAGGVIPEPATITLVCLSIAAVGSALRRRLRDRSPRLH